MEEWEEARKGLGSDEMAEDTVETVGAALLELFSEVAEDDVDGSPAWLLETRFPLETRSSPLAGLPFW